jgi:hypothetical protein
MTSPAPALAAELPACTVPAHAQERIAKPLLLPGCSVGAGTFFLFMSMSLKLSARTLDAQVLMRQLCVFLPV